MLLNVLRNRAFDFIIGALRLGRLDDIGFGNLARSLVGDLDDGAVGDGRVGEEVGFQLGRSDLVTLNTISMCNLDDAATTLNRGGIPSP